MYINPPDTCRDAILSVPYKYLDYIRIKVLVITIFNFHQPIWISQPF